MSKLYDKKFERQVKHLSGYVGMPMWNGRNPTLSEIREYDRRVLEQQSKVSKPRRKSLIKKAYIWLAKVSSKGFSQIDSAKSKAKSKKDLTEIGTECCG